jgi:hypothetical protein
MTHKTWPILFAGLLVAALSAAGCARGIATGGGTIPAANPDTEVKGATKANFGFWGDSCGAETAGNFNYHDKSVSDSLGDKKGGGLKIIGRVTDVCDCTGFDEDGDDCADLCLNCWAAVSATVDTCLDACSTNPECYAACVALFPGGMAALEGDFYSTNPKYEDEGEVRACVVDNGEGSNAPPDLLYIALESDGPYDGYQNGGPVSGNIQTYPCID